MDQIPVSRPMSSDDHPGLRTEDKEYATIDANQNTYESLSTRSARGLAVGKEPRPPGRRVSFRCALVLGVSLCVIILGVVAFMAYYFTAGNGSANMTASACIFTYEGRYDLDDKTDPPLTTEPSLESCLRRCLNSASVCKGLSYNLHAGSGACEPRNVEADLSTRTKLEDYVEYTMACTGVTTSNSPTTTPMTTPTVTNCRVDWIGHDGSCYRFFNRYWNWTAAKDGCIAQAAHLMTIDSLEEEAYLKNTYMVPNVQKKTGHAQIWIGGEYSSGVWRWITTLEAVCTCYQWSNRGPYSTSVGFCLAYHPYDNEYYGEIYDYPCTHTRPYLCEYETN